MNVKNLACAPSTDEMLWSNVNWNQCHQSVTRLQTRIVKATQESRWGKVKALQWLLTHSFSGRALAVKRVTENQGKRTSGVDKKIWSTSKSKSLAIASLRRRGYQPHPLKRVYIPKGKDKHRPLGIPTMKDRAMQALYLLSLEPIAETTADRNSYGFRPKRSTADAIEQCFTKLARKDAAQWILEGDIKGCFDNINHDWLITHIPMDKVILQKWLKCGVLENQIIHPTRTGTPQGGIISPILANMALDGLEKFLEKSFYRTSKKGKMLNPKVQLIRYADDFIITGASRELLENKVKPLVESFMKIRGLELSKEKTKTVHINEGFDFLGQNIRKYGNKLLIKPSKKNAKACASKIRGIVKANKTAKQYTLIKLLNPIIRGWADYHKHVVAKRTFRWMDYKIWQTLWRWAKRRHPNKSRTWIKAKYFKIIKNRHWSFATEEMRPDKRKNWVNLRLAAETVIKRHIKIKTEANPFDPQWKSYFQKRAYRQIVSTELPCLE